MEIRSGLITSILKEISEKYELSISTLKLNARILKELNLISYGTASNPRNVELTELGRFVLSLIKNHHIPDTSQTREEALISVGHRRLKAKISTLRRRVVNMIAEAGSGHLGSSLSALEIIATLYFAKMRHDPTNSSWQYRDRFLLGKGHAAPALYAVLAECGYFPKAELSELRSLGGLPGHPELGIPGVDMASGSLGQCLSVANGMALSAKLDGDDYRVYVLLGDGELNEGQVWEAAMSATRFGLYNLTVFIDRNGSQLSGPTESVKPLEPLADKWRAFGWAVLEIDGSSPEQILLALDESEAAMRPTVILARTVKSEDILLTEGKAKGSLVYNGDGLLVEHEEPSKE